MHFHFKMGGSYDLCSIHHFPVLAIELLCACQAVEFLRPLKSTPPLEAVYKLVRGVVG